MKKNQHFDNLALMSLR